jgi:DNA-binding transcriptional MocR family regulator
MRSPKSDKLFAEIVSQIESGAIPLGSQLPTHRDLARDKSVSLSVVNRVYGDLKRKGLAEASGRRGTVLTSGQSLPIVAASHAEKKTNRISDVIDLSHNYASLPELNREIKLLFSSAIPDYCDDPTHGKTESLVSRIGKQWLSLLSIPSKNSIVDDFSVLGCSGGQHGILACLLAFSGLGQNIAVTPFTYTGLKLAASVLGIKLTTVATDTDGMLPAELERAAKQRSIKAAYLMPSFHNPLGTTTSATRRRQLAAAFQKHDIFVIEDDPHRYLMSRVVPSFFELMPERCVHVTTMSKVLGPTMRLGFIATSQRNSMRLQSAIRAANWGLPLLEADVMATALDQFLPNSILTLRNHARKRQATARKIFKGHELIGSSSAPHLCIKLERNWKSSQLSSVSLEYGFKISAGTLYASDKAAESELDFIRVSLMSEPEESRLVEGLHRLRELMDASPAAFLSAS